jgi:hypothetical protein
MPRLSRFHSRVVLPADRGPQTPRRIRAATGATRMPSRPAVWVDLFRETCAILAPHATRCAMGLQIAFASGAVTVR